MRRILGTRRLFPFLSFYSHNDCGNLSNWIAIVGVHWQFSPFFMNISPSSIVILHQINFFLNKRLNYQDR